MAANRCEAFLSRTSSARPRRWPLSSAPWQFPPRPETFPSLQPHRCLEFHESLKQRFARDLEMFRVYRSRRLTPTPSPFNDPFQVLNRIKESGREIPSSALPSAP